MTTSRSCFIFRLLAAASLLATSALFGCDDGDDPGPQAAADAGSTSDVIVHDDVAADAGTGSDAAQPAPQFAFTPVQWAATIPPGDGQRCYRFASRAEVPCGEGLGWDLMAEAAGQSWSLWTNSGVRGSGYGAAFGPMDSAAAAKTYSIADVPGWFADKVGGAFLDKPWYSYNALGTHDVSANFRVYAVKTAAQTYKVQLRSYYGAGGKSAQIQLYWTPVSGGDVRQASIDASAGGFGAKPSNPLNRFTFFDLDEGKVVDITPEQAKASNTTWDLAFKRFDVIANGGISGPGGVLTALAAEVPGLYDEAGKPVAAAFRGLKPEQASALLEGAVTIGGLAFAADRGAPTIVGDGGPQSWFKMAFGASGPSFDANPDAWWAVRGASWDAFAKLHVIKVERKDGTRTFHLELFVQDGSEGNEQP